jgi:hypothetical protein
VVQIEEYGVQVKASEEAFEKESAQKANLLLTLNELEAMKLEKDSNIRSKMDTLSVAETEPNRIMRQVSCPVRLFERFHLTV